MEMFHLEYENMNVCQRNVARFVQVECRFDKIKVQLTPNLFFRLFKISYFSDRHCEKIIVVAFFVNFLWIFKVRKMSLFGAPRPSSSEEWGELVCDVIEGLTKFCF